MKKWRKSMKLMKLFLTGALALSVLSSPAVMAMEPAPKPTGPATAAEIAQAQTCGICYDELTNGQNIRTLRCNANGIPHIFHRQCINDWLISQQRNNQPALCPMCQTPAVPEFTFKEQAIAKLGDINYQHNPLSVYNRKLIPLTASLSAISALGTILATPLIAKALNLTQLPYHKSLARFAPDYLKSGIAAFTVAAIYCQLKYNLTTHDDQRANPEQVVRNTPQEILIKITAKTTAIPIIAIILVEYLEKKLGQAKSS